MRRRPPSANVEMRSKKVPGRIFDDSGDTSAFPDHVQSIITSYRRAISKEMHTCRCCNQMWFQHSVLAYVPDRYKKPIARRKGKKENTAAKVVNCSRNDSHWICRSCHKDLMAGFVPKLCPFNRTSIPTPSNDDERLLRSLNPVEERCVSPS